MALYDEARIMCCGKSLLCVGRPRQQAACNGVRMVANSETMPARLSSSSESDGQLACGLFTAAALYINLVEQPAKLPCGITLAVTQWRPSYKRGTVMQASLAILGSLTKFNRVGSNVVATRECMSMLDFVTVLKIWCARGDSNSRPSGS